jgi:hypothetical protein
VNTEKLCWKFLIFALFNFFFYLFEYSTLYTAISNGNYFDKHKNKQNAKGATQKMKSSECWEFLILVKQDELAVLD